MSVDKQINETFKVTDVDAVVQPTKDAEGKDVRFGFRNVHYFAAGATLYGSQAQMGYEYEGKSYDPKFRHVESFDTCVECHDQHATQIRIDACQACHPDATTVEDVKNNRENGSLEDYNGNGDTKEGIYYELKGLQDILYSSIQMYAAEVAGTGVAYDPASYPYWFADADGDGTPDQKDGENVSYSTWTARLLKAAYNYQVSAKDPGAFTHNSKYIIELLYDSIEDLNAKLSTLAPPADVSLAGCVRVDDGHFNGSSEAWRHWDVATAPALPGPPGSCAKCHAAKGIPFFLTNNVNIQEEPANGMLCVNCHSSVTDTVAPLRAVKDVTFPSTLKANMGGAGATDDNNVCLLCHQGPESKKSIDDKIAADADGVVSFSNVHYYAAAASLFGTQVKGGYEYTGKTYAGQNPFASHGSQFNKCVQCHMGSDGLNPAYASHRVTTPNPNNCVCHIGVAPIAAMLIQMAISRSREYAADAGGAQLHGQPMALANALRKLHSGSQEIPMHATPATSHMMIVSPLAGGSFMKLVSTHPPVEERIARLQPMRMGQYR